MTHLKANNVIIVRAKPMREAMTPAIDKISRASPPEPHPPVLVHTDYEVHGWGGRERVYEHDTSC